MLALHQHHLCYSCRPLATIITRQLHTFHMCTILENWARPKPNLYHLSMLKNTVHVALLLKLPYSKFKSKIFFSDCPVICPEINDPMCGTGINKKNFKGWPTNEMIFIYLVQTWLVDLTDLNFISLMQVFIGIIFTFRWSLLVNGEERWMLKPLVLINGT